MNPNWRYDTYEDPAPHNSTMPDPKSAPDWSRYTISVERLSAGQPRPYADSVYEAILTYDQPCSASMAKRQFAFLVHNFKEKDAATWHDAYLEFFKPSGNRWVAPYDEGGKNPFFSTWHGKVIEPYLD